MKMTALLLALCAACTTNPSESASEQHAICQTCEPDPGDDGAGEQATLDYTNLNYPGWEEVERLTCAPSPTGNGGICGLSITWMGHGIRIICTNETGQFKCTAWVR